MARFCSLSSGSSGNSIYVGSGNYGILIDAGISTISITRALKERGTDISKILGIFITHEHSDHIKGLAVISRKFSIPIYVNNGTLQGIYNQNLELNQNLIRIIDVGESTVVADMEITSFATPHDANESVGYRIHTADGRKIGIATDLGDVTESVETGLTGCDFVMLESNHDENMLKNGGYPYYLKRRILGNRGHLSNNACANLLTQLVNSGSSRFVLGHISRENNMPEIAYQTTLQSISAKGLKVKQDFELETASQGIPSRLHIF
jgi:phosphoribosyl 1,2-cyclic phosphodiesterase